MRVFEITGRVLELRGVDDHLIGVYLPGMRYVCRDPASLLAVAVERWLRDGDVRIIENEPGTGPAQVAGVATVT